MSKKIKKKNIDNEGDDYIIDNDQELDEFENNNQNYKYNINIKNQSYSNDRPLSKEQFQSNKSPKSSKRNGGEWIKEAKAKYQSKKINNFNKNESKIPNKSNKKIMNFDDIPVGGGGMGGNDFNIEIKVPTKRNKFIQNNEDNYEDNLEYNKEINSKKNFKDNSNSRRKSNNNYYDDENNNINNNEPVEMERKNSLVSIMTQTCEHEMVGRSEFIDIPLNNNNLNSNINNSNQINLDSKLARLTEKQPFSIYDKNENNLISKKNSNFKDNLDTSKISSINRLTDYSTTQNIREKTENAIQLQNVQRELDNEIEMNKRLQGQIENYKSEFNNLREELVKKSDIINELQQKISKLEKDLFLQGNKLLEAESKPSQEHYEDIVSNYEEMKKNFDKAIERIKFLSDENAELKERNKRLEENNKKLKKEIKTNKDKFIHKSDEKRRIKNINNPFNNNNFENEDEYENNNNYNNENDDDINDKEEYKNEYQDKNLISKNAENNNEKINKEQKNNNNIEEKKQINEKRSIIPEDNDIFGTRGYETNNKNPQKPRRIQEDGIPVIKRMEEKDNVKDIMVNNYATYDDDYYNRPPIGKPKARRIKRNTNTTNNFKNNICEKNLNNIGEPKAKIISSEVKISDNDYKDNNFNNNINDNDKYINYNKNKFRSSPINNKEYKNQRSGIGGITTSVGVFPSQINVMVNEREILDLESKLFNLQKERDLINDEYLKFPEYPKKREEINAKRKVEIKLEEMNKQISLQKLKIRELKEQNK